MVTSRRELLRGASASTLGISSLLLPAAAGAASVLDDAAPATPERLLAWSYSNNVTRFGAVSSGSLAQTSRIDPTVSGTFAFSDLATVDTGQNKWNAEAQSATLDTGSAPYLAWTIATTGSGLDLQYLAVHGFAADGGSNFTASFRHSGDGYTTDLRAVTPVGIARNFLVDLSSLPVVTSSVTIRMFIHGNTFRQGVFAMNFANLSPFQVGVDEYLSAQGPDSQCFSVIGTLAD